MKICSRTPFLAIVLSVSLLCAVRGAAQTSGGSKIVGDWAATLSADGSELHLALHIVAGPDGSFTSTVDSIDQGEYGTATTTTTFKDHKLTFSIDPYHVTYEGTLRDDGSRIDGKFTQGQSFPLNWTRAPAESGAFSAVIGKLSGLQSLPDGVWKTHAGDLAHGEAIGLDESDWQALTKDGKVGTDAVWLRQTFRVPADLKGYDLAGARIWFHLNANADSPIPEILYFDGRRVAMGDDLEPVVMFERAKPGDTVTVAMKMLHTTKVKTVFGSTLRVEAASIRPDPEDLRLELLTANRLLPSLVTGDPAPMAALRDATRAVDISALDAHDQARFDSSLKAAHAKLEPLKPLMQQVTFHLTGQSHIDAAWLWPWTETVDVVKRTFGTALQLMHEYPQYTYTQSAAAYNEWLAQKYPDMNAEIARRIKEGRWEVVGGMWVEPDLNLPDGESLVRQLLVGKRWFKQAYGVDVKVGWNPDSFGYTAQLPQIYKKSGVDYFLTTKMTWNDTNQLPFKLFWWQSPDGSKVLTYFPPGLSTDLNPSRESNDFVERRKMAPGTMEMMDIYGVGDHGGGPTRALLDEGFHWAGKAADGEDHIVPKYEFGLALPFFSSIEKQIAPESPSWNYQSIAKGYRFPSPVPGKISIPTWTSDLYLEYHRGIYTTQANHKRNMRDAEVEVLDAEKWSSLAWVLAGRTYPAVDLTEDWKKVLFNQFHDLAAGSGIGVIYQDAQKDYDAVRWSTDEISTGAFETVTQRIDTSAGGKITQGQVAVVFNPLGWARSGEVKVPGTGYPNGFEIRDPVSGVEHASQELPVEMVGGIAEYRVPVADVPALGYKVLQITPSAANGHPTSGDHGPEAREQGDRFVLENGNLRVAIDKKSGCITSLYEKHSRFEALAAGGCGNQLQAFSDKPKDYDAWNIDPGTLDQPPTLLVHPERVELVGNDAVRVTQTWQSSKFVQTIRLDRTTPQVDIDNEIDWHETHVLLKAAFPLANSAPFATFEVPYGSIERPTTRNNSWEKAQFEVPAMRWADLGGVGPDGLQHGLSILNNSKYGYDAVSNVLRLTLLRSPIDPDPEADRGHHHFSYAIYPHPGTWKDALTVRRGYEYNYPLTAIVTAAHAGTFQPEHSFVSVGPENVVLTAVKKAEDAPALIFRVYEWAGKEATAEFHVPPGATSAVVTNMQETPEGAPAAIADDVVKIPIHPYEILTVRVNYSNGGLQK